jgi:NAD-dependent SIR2 family protein deacetylase
VLRRIYSQNIDNLEQISGIDTEKLVECHGHFRSSSCISCRAPMDIEACRRKIVDELEVPQCNECGSHVKPDIVFFGEELPPRFQQLVDDDTAKADLVIVIGTSLLVMPVAGIPSWVPRECPRVLLNRELVGDFRLGQPRDIFVQGECDDGARKICSLAGWQDLLEDRFQACQ